MYSVWRFNQAVDVSECKFRRRLYNRLIDRMISLMAVAKPGQSGIIAEQSKFHCERLNLI